jgi:predicted ester cyclase
VTDVSNAIAIDGPVDLVFDLVTTTRSWPFWHPATESVSGVTDRPLALGDQVNERASIGGRVHEGTWTVSEHDPGARLVLQIGGGRIQITYTFARSDTATLLTRTLSYQPQDFAGGEQDPDALEARMRAQSELALQRLKPIVESQIPLEQNKRAARRILEQGFNQGNLDALADGFTPDAAIHDPDKDYRGPAELRRGLQVLHAAFPDFHFTIVDQVAEGDRVTIRYRAQATHQAEFLGVPATGRRIDYTGQLLLRFTNGRISEFWAQPDQLGLLKQLGARVELGDVPAAAHSA